MKFFQPAVATEAVKNITECFLWLKSIRKLLGLSS